MQRPHLNGHARSEVAGEEGCGQLDALDDAGHAEAYDCPVVAGNSLTTRLPAVHPLAELCELVHDEDGVSGFNEVVRSSEPVVSGEQNAATELCAGQLWELLELGEFGLILPGDTCDAWTGPTRTRYVHGYSSWVQTEVT